MQFGVANNPPEVGNILSYPGQPTFLNRNYKKSCPLFLLILSKSTENMTRLQESVPLFEQRSDKNKKVKSIVTAIVILLIGAFILFKKGLLSSTHPKMPLLHRDLKLRVYTNNIRFDNHHPDRYERLWEERKQQVTASIAFNTDPGYANVVCLQEVLHNQLVDILYNLNNQNTTDEWTYFGVGRTDGKEAGEHGPILYKSSEWVLLDSRTFWLSETPDKPSIGWDAVLERIVTMVTLQSKINPMVKLNFFNTHFDHIGEKARKHSSELIINKMRNYNSYPSFLCGDFNTEPTAEPYKILTEAGFRDSRVLIDDLHKYGHEHTFTGFDHTNPDNTIIDYIWAPEISINGNEKQSMEDSDSHKKYHIKIKSFGVLENFFRGFHLSDHRPVSADFLVSGSFNI